MPAGGDVARRERGYRGRYIVELANVAPHLESTLEFSISVEHGVLNRYRSEPGTSGHIHG